MKIMLNQKNKKSLFSTKLKNTFSIQELDIYMHCCALSQICTHCNNNGNSNFLLKKKEIPLFNHSSYFF